MCGKPQEQLDRMDRNVPLKLRSMQTEDRRKSRRTMENSDVLSQVQAVMKKTDVLDAPHPASGGRSELRRKRRAGSAGKAKPKKTAAVINLHVEQGCERRKEKHAPLGAAQAKDATSSATETCMRAGVQPVRMRLQTRGKKLTFQK